MSGSDTLPDGHHMNLVVRHRKDSGEPGVGLESTTDSHRDTL